MDAVKSIDLVTVGLLATGHRVLAILLVGTYAVNRALMAAWEQ